MPLFRTNTHKELSQEIKSVADKADKTANELEIVKKRQLDIERRLTFLNAELEVQQRKSL